MENSFHMKEQARKAALHVKHTKGRLLHLDHAAQDLQGSQAVHEEHTLCRVDCVSEGDTLHQAMAICAAIFQVFMRRVCATSTGLPMKIHPAVVLFLLVSITVEAASHGEIIAETVW